MIEIVFTTFMIAVFGRLLVYAFRFAWGFSKALVTLLLMPLFLVGMVVAGVIQFALPILILIAVMSWILEPAA